MKPLTHDQALANAKSIADVSEDLTSIVISELNSVRFECKHVRPWSAGGDVPQNSVDRWLLTYHDTLISDNYLNDIQMHFANEYKNPRKIQTALVQPDDCEVGQTKRKLIIGKHDTSFFSPLLQNAPTIDKIIISPSADFLFVGIEGLATFLDTFNYLDDHSSPSLPSSITLVESRPEAFAYAAYLLDYKRLFGLAKDKKLILKIILRQDSEHAFAEYLMHLTHAIPAAFYRSLVFTSPFLDQSLLSFLDRIFAPESLLSRLMSRLGDSGDEINQLQQYICNLQNKRSIDILDISHGNPPQSSVYEGPAILAGSGPSLDQSIDTIKRLESSHIIFAAGSSIGTLLRNNIRPDFLVLLERGGSLYDDLLGLSREGYCFKQMVLICSLSIDYRIPKMFDDVIFFNREPNAPTELISIDPCCSLPCAGPESLNAAIEIISLVGFPLVYGFGVDFGSPTRDYTRSKDAMGVYIRQFDRPVLGSTQKTFYTSDALIYSSQIFDLTLKTYPQTKFIRNSVGLPLNNCLARPPLFDAGVKDVDCAKDLIPTKTLLIDPSFFETVIDNLDFSRRELLSHCVGFRRAYLANDRWTSELHKSFAHFLCPSNESSTFYVGAAKTIRSYAFYAGQYIRFMADQDCHDKAEAIDWYLDSIAELYSFGLDVALMQLMSSE